MSASACLHAHRFWTDFELFAQALTPSTVTLTKYDTMFELNISTVSNTDVKAISSASSANVIIIALRNNNDDNINNSLFKSNVDADLYINNDVGKDLTSSAAFIMYSRMSNDDIKLSTSAIDTLKTYNTLYVIDTESSAVITKTITYESNAVIDTESSAVITKTITN